MEKAEVIKIGDEKLIRLPKDFNLKDDEVVMRRIGSMLLFVPRHDTMHLFEEAINGFTDDFFPNGREPQTYIK